jgi:hypothetical protein
MFPSVEAFGVAWASIGVGGDSTDEVGAGRCVEVEFFAAVFTILPLVGVAEVEKPGNGRQVCGRNHNARLPQGSFHLGSDARNCIGGTALPVVDGLHCVFNGQTESLGLTEGEYLTGSSTAVVDHVDAIREVELVFEFTPSARV